MDQTNSGRVLGVVWTAGRSGIEKQSPIQPFIDRYMDMPEDDYFSTGRYNQSAFDEPLFLHPAQHVVSFIEYIAIKASMPVR